MSSNNLFKIQEGFTKSKEKLLKAINEQERYFKTDVINLLRRLVECEDSIFNYCTLLNSFRGSELFEKIAWYNIEKKVIKILNGLDIPTEVRISLDFFNDPEAKEMSINFVTNSYTVKALSISFEIESSYSSISPEKKIIAIDMFKFADPPAKLIENHKYEIDRISKTIYGKDVIPKRVGSRTKFIPIYGGINSMNEKDDRDEIDELRNTIQKLEKYGDVLYATMNILYEKLTSEFGADVELQDCMPYTDYERIRIKSLRW